MLDDKFIKELENTLSVSLKEGFLTENYDHDIAKRLIKEEYCRRFPQTQYRVVCDDTNNTEEDIKNNVVKVTVYKD